MYVGTSLILNSWPTALELIPKWSLSNAYIFYVRHVTAALCLGTLASTILKGHFKKWNHRQKAQKFKKHSTKMTKRTLVYSMSWSKKAEWPLVWLQLGKWTSGNKYVHGSVRVHSDQESTVSIGFGVKGKLANAESVHNEGWLYVVEWPFSLAMHGSRGRWRSELINPVGFISRMYLESNHLPLQVHWFMPPFSLTWTIATASICFLPFSQFSTQQPFEM